jgi:hypothetical protein
MSATPAPPGAPSYAPEPATIGVSWKTPDGARVDVLVNRTQLHGEACMLCARMDAPLEDAGHVYTEAGGWRARVCAGGCKQVAA